MRSTYDILSDLAPKWEQMSEAEKVSLGITLAGVNQYKVFSAVMENFKTAVNATTTAYNSSGSAMKENSAYMESLEAKATALKAQFQELVLSGGVLDKLAKVLLDIGIAILKLANNDFVQIIAVSAGLTYAIGMASKAFEALKASMIITKLAPVIEVFKQITSAIIGLVRGDQYAVVATEELNVALASLELNPVMIAITAIIGTIYGVVKAIESYNERAEKANEETKKVRDELREGQDQLKNYEDRLKQVNEELEKYNKLNNEGNQGKINDLKLEKAELESLLKVQQLLNMEKATEYKEQAEKGVGTRVNTTVLPNELVGVVNALSAIAESEQPLTTLADSHSQYEGTRQEYIEQSIKKMREYGEEAQKVSQEIQNLGDTEEDNAKKKKLEEKQNKLIEDFHKLRKQSAEYANQLSEETKDLGDNDDLKKSVLGTIKELADFTGVLSDEQKKSLGITDEDTDATEDNASAKSMLANEIKDLQSNYETLSSIVEDYNDDGILSMENLENLLNLSDQYLACLEMQDGQLVLNEQSMQALAYAKIDEAEATAYNETMEKLNTLAKEEGAKASDNSQEATKNATQVAIEGAKQALASAEAWDAYWSSVENSKNIKSEYKAKADEYGAELKKTLTVMESAKKGFGSYSKATSKSSGSTRDNTRATRENTDAIKAQTEALKNAKEAIQKEVDAYKSAISYINSKIDSEIDKLKTLKQEAVDGIKAQIDALNEQKDKEEEYWEEKINALKDQNDALEDQIEYEKLLEALERAKSQKVKVYREGQGYVYETDQSAVNEARQSIIEYNRKKQQEKELKELEDLRDAKLASYDKQIADLEAYQKKVEDDYDFQIKYFEAYKNKFKDQVDSYEREQNRLITLQLTGIDFEQQGWQTRLNNLDGFVNNYIAKLQELQRATEAYEQAQKQSASNISSYSSGGGGGSARASSGGGGNTYSEKVQTLQRIINAINETGTTGNLGIANIADDGIMGNGTKNAIRALQRKIGVVESGNYDDATAWALGAWLNKMVSYNWLSLNEKNRYKFIKATHANLGGAFATGVAKIDEDQIAITGENPYKELVLGSKVNNGVLTSLSKGSGVVNAKSTKTLAGLLNQLGGINMGNGHKLNDIANNTSISIGNISLPQVKNGKDFVDYLQNFSLDMKQRAYT